MPEKTADNIADAMAERVFPLKEVFQRQNAVENRMSILEVQLQSDRDASKVRQARQDEQFGTLHANLADQDRKLDALVLIGSETAGAWKANKFWLATMGGALGLLVAVLVAYIEIGRL